MTLSTQFPNTKINYKLSTANTTELRRHQLIGFRKYFKITTLALKLDETNDLEIELVLRCFLKKSSIWY